VNGWFYLVVTNRHVPNLSDLNDDEKSRMLDVAQRLGRVLRMGIVQCEGINLLLADGEAAGQEMFHTHLQLCTKTKLRTKISHAKAQRRKALPRF
jgi:histidine triad (HIT) family protein